MFPNFAANSESPGKPFKGSNCNLQVFKSVRKFPSIPNTPGAGLLPGSRTFLFNLFERSKHMEFNRLGSGQSIPIATIGFADPGNPVELADRDQLIPGVTEKPLDFWTSSQVLAKSEGQSVESGGPRRQCGSRADLIVAVEGENDARFLKRISAILHRDDNRVPDLGMLERSGILIFVPIGGSNFRDWANRLQGLGMREFHLLDRETPPLTADREEVVGQINRREGCLARLTQKRALENYLHSDAVLEARGVEVEITDSMDVADAVAKQVFERMALVAWSEIPSRSRRRLRNQAKKWLNTTAADLMTPHRIDARDPDGEIREWMGAITSLLNPGHVENQSA